MQEIEVKARVRDGEALRAGLASLGVSLGPPVSQDDTIYTEGNWEFTKFQSQQNIMRIRRQDGTAILTLKRPGSNELDSAEHETEVADPEETHEILLLMGYQPIVGVRKRRQKGRHGGMEICLDEVEGLGTYVEAERLVEEGADAEDVQEEMFVFLESLGVRREDRETHGYDTLLVLKEKAADAGA